MWEDRTPPTSNGHGIWWFGTRWMTDLINNIVKKGCIPDNWRKSIIVGETWDKGDLDHPIYLVKLLTNQKTNASIVYTNAIIVDTAW